MKREEREQWWLRQGNGTSVLLRQEKLILSKAPGKSLGLNAEGDS